MITISRISKQSYINSILNCKKDIKWFYETLAKKEDKNLYYLLKKGDTEVGVLINYYNRSNFDFGICIYEKYKNKGFASNVVIQLNQKFNGLVKFTINKHNINSREFFYKLVKIGIINQNNIRFS